MRRGPDGSLGGGRCACGSPSGAGPADAAQRIGQPHQARSDTRRCRHPLRLASVRPRTKLPALLIGSGAGARASPAALTCSSRVADAATRTEVRRETRLGTPRTPTGARDTAGAWVLSFCSISAIWGGRMRKNSAPACCSKSRIPNVRALDALRQRPCATRRLSCAFRTPSSFRTKQGHQCRELLSIGPRQLGWGASCVCTPAGQA